MDKHTSSIAKIHGHEIAVWIEKMMILFQNDVAESDIVAVFEGSGDAGYILIVRMEISNYAILRYGLVSQWIWFSEYI